MGLSAVVIASAIWAVCCLAWFVRCDRRLTSPLLLYLVFHGLTFVVRPWMLYVTQDAGYMQRVLGLHVHPEDHERAIAIASAGLIAMTIGAVIGEQWARARATPVEGRTLDAGVVRVVGALVITLGLVSYVVYAPNPLRDTVDREIRTTVVRSQQGTVGVSGRSTAYVTSAYYFIGGTLIAMIAFLGFRLRWLIPVGVYVAALMYTGSARTFYLLAVIGIALALLGHYGRRWPPLPATVLLLVVIAAFLGGKGWAQTLHSDGRSAALEQITGGWERSLSAESALLVNYDTFVTATVIVPRYASHTHESLYLRPLYMWVPRAVWPEKPVFNYAGAYIQGAAPELSFSGRMVTLAGESYMSFGLAGVVILSLVYGALFSALAMRLFRAPPNSIERILGIALLLALVQAYRDGVVSLPQYLLFYFGPCALMWCVASLLGKVRTVEVSPPPALTTQPTVAPESSPSILARG